MTVLHFTVYFTTQAETDFRKKNITMCSEWKNAVSWRNVSTRWSEWDSKRLKDVERYSILLKEKVDTGMKTIKGRPKFCKRF